MSNAATEIASDELFRKARTDTYALLTALLIRPPSAQLLVQLQGIESNPALPAPLTRARTTLLAAAARYSVQAIEKEFQILFIGLGQGEVVPYGSWYLEGLLMTLPLARLRLDLIKLGIGRRKEVYETEDHAGLLCETMALLGANREISDHEYARFFDAHVGSWMFDFFSDIQNAPSARFYRSVARLGSCLLELEQQFLSANCPEPSH